MRARALQSPSSSSRANLFSSTKRNQITACKQLAHLVGQHIQRITAQCGRQGTHTSAQSCAYHATAGLQLLRAAQEIPRLASSSFTILILLGIFQGGRTRMPTWPGRTGWLARTDKLTWQAAMDVPRCLEEKSTEP